jgi:hypothetical protein
VKLTTIRFCIRLQFGALKGLFADISFEVDQIVVVEMLMPNRLFVNCRKGLRALVLGKTSGVGMALMRLEASAK